MEDGGGEGKEKSHKRPHSPEDDIVFVSFKKEKKDPELSKGLGTDATEEDVVIVEETQEATGTSSSVAKSLGKEDFVVTYFKPSDTIKYPHAREDCRVHKFQSGSYSTQENATFCDSCYCYVCDIPAKECKQWIQDNHCNAYSKDASWKLKRNKTIAANSRKKARRAFASHPSLRSCLSKEEREAEGMSSIHDSSLDEMLNRIDSTYKAYQTNDYETAHEEDECYCGCHDDCWYYEDEPCYDCEDYHYRYNATPCNDYDPVRRALNSAVALARTHWQNKKPLEALIVLEETMRSLCLHQPCDVTLNEVILNSYGDRRDGGLVTSKREVMRSIEELLVDMFVDRSGVLASSLREKALSAIKRIFELAPRDSGNIRPDVALGLKDWDDPDLLAVLDGSYNSVGGQSQAANSSGGNSTAEVIVVDATTSDNSTAVNSRNSSFTEDYLVVKKRLQILENEKRWQEAANYIQRVNIKNNQYGNGSRLKDRLLTFQAHLGNWKEVRSELLKSDSSPTPRLARMNLTDFLNIMKCFTTGQDIEMLPASSVATPAPSPDVNIDEVFRVYLHALAKAPLNSFEYNEKCVSWFIAWTCQETLKEISWAEFQKCEKQAKSVIETSRTRVTKLEQGSTLNNKIGRALVATCWLSFNWSSHQYVPLHDVSGVMDGYKNNLWLAVFLLFRLSEDLKARFNYRLSDICHRVANWISFHEGFDLQRGSSGIVVFRKVLSVLTLAKAKEVLETFLAAVFAGNKTPKEKEKTILQAKTAVSKLANSREFIGKVLVYMAKVGKCTEVQQELMKGKQDATFRPLKTIAQIGDQDFLAIMKALVETGGKLWGVGQATHYIENEIFTICIKGLVWNDKIQQSMSFIAWFLGLVCVEKMDKPCDSLIKTFDDITKSMKEVADKSTAVDLLTSKTERKECKAVVACMLSLPGFKSKGYSSWALMKNTLDTLMQNQWLLKYVLNHPDGPRGTVVADWIYENGPMYSTHVLNELTEDATKSLVLSMENDAGFKILKRLVGSSGDKSLEVRRKIVLFSECLLNRLKKYDRMSNEILAYAMTKVDPIAKTVDGPSAKAFLQQLYQKNFEFCPTMKSLEELKKVCSVPTCLTCLVLLMRGGSDHVTQLLSRPVAKVICSRKGEDAFSPATSDVINKIAAVLREIPSADAVQFLQKAQSWLVAESWGSVLCCGRACKNKVQPSMDTLWRMIAQISPQDLVIILKAAMEGVEKRLNVISVNLAIRNAYISWLLRVKDAFQLAGQLYQFGKILNRSMHMLRRKKTLTNEVRSSGILHNLPDKENPLNKNPAVQNAKKKGNGASPNLSNALQTLNISNTGKNTNNAAAMLMKELIADKSAPVADSCGFKHQPTCASANSTPMEWSNNGNSVKKASRQFWSSAIAQFAGKSEKKSGYQTRSKDKSSVQSSGTCALQQTAKIALPPCTNAPATGSNSSATAASVVPTNATGNTGGAQNSGSTELVNIVSKILELTKTAGVDGAFQLIIGRMTGKVASSSPLAEDIISKLLKMKGPINLKIGNNKLVINAQPASSSPPAVPNVPTPQPAQIMPSPRRATTVPYADPTTASITQSAPQHRYGTVSPNGPNALHPVQMTGPNALRPLQMTGPKALRPVLPLALSTATSCISTYVPGAVTPGPNSRGIPVPATPVPVQASTHSAPVTGVISGTSSSSTTKKAGLSFANNNNNNSSRPDTALKPSTQAPGTQFAADILRKIISDIGNNKGTASRVGGKLGEPSKMPTSDNVSTEPTEAAMDVPMEVE